MITTRFFVPVLLIVMGMCNAQAQGTKTTLGVSAQFYPAGVIPTINLQAFSNENASWLFRLGANITDRKDFSDVNATEEGSGFGGSVGYRKHFPVGMGKFVAGLNMDVWSLNIDWTDTIGGDVIISGSTYILVVQPWLEGGYFLPLRNTRSQLGLTLGFGREFNVITSGQEVAQGFIGSVSLHYQFTL